MKIRIALENLLQDEAGATLVEYGLILTLVCITAIAALSFLGGGLSSLFSNVKADI